MKIYLLFIMLFLFTKNAPLLANSQEIAAVYHNEIPPIKHSKNKSQKNTAKKKPIIQKSQGLKQAGIVLLIVGGVIFAAFFTMFLVGVWSSLVLMGIGALFALLGLTGIILGAVFLGVAKKKGL